MQSRSQKSDIIPDILNLLAKAAAVVWVMALAYIAFLTFSGEFRFYPQGYTATSASNATQMLDSTGKALLIASIVFVLSLVLLFINNVWLFWGNVLVGLCLYLLLPYVSVPYLSTASRDLSQRFHPGADILIWWRLSGMAFLGGAALMMIAAALDQLRVSLSAPRKATGGVRLPFYSACWQTYHCKVEISKYCAPGLKNFRKSCWRHKSGCFCDDSIGDRVLSLARKDQGKELMDLIGPPARAPEPTLGDRFRSTHHRVKGQRIACADCPIYNYHEAQKHKLLAPIVILAIPALMYYRWDTLHVRYAYFIRWLDTVSTRAVFTPEGSASLTKSLHSALDVSGMEVLVWITVGLIAVTLAARFLEWWCFEAKL